MLSPRLARGLEVVGLVVLLGTVGVNLFIGPSLQRFDTFVEAQVRQEAVTQRLDVLWRYLGEQERLALESDAAAVDFAELDAAWQAARQYPANTSVAREAANDLTDQAWGAGFVWYLIGAALFLGGRYARRRELE